MLFNPLQRDRFILLRFFDQSGIMAKWTAKIASCHVQGGNDFTIPIKKRCFNKTFYFQFHFIIFLSNESCLYCALNGSNQLSLSPCQFFSRCSPSFFQNADKEPRSGSLCLYRTR